MNKSKLTASRSQVANAHSLPNIWSEAVSRAVDNIPEDARMYRLPQVLALLPMSRAKFLKLIQEGKAPPPIKFGRSSFWVPSEIRLYIQAQIEATRATNPFDIDSLVAEIIDTKK